MNASIAIAERHDGGVLSLDFYFFTYTSRVTRPSPASAEHGLRVRHARRRALPALPLPPTHPLTIVRFGQRAPKCFSSFTTFSCLQSMAADNGVQPCFVALGLTLAPAWISANAQASCPLLAAR